MFGWIGLCTLIAATVGLGNIFLFIYILLLAANIFHFIDLLLLVWISKWIFLRQFLNAVLMFLQKISNDLSFPLDSIQYWNPFLAKHQLAGRKSEDVFSSSMLPCFARRIFLQFTTLICLCFVFIFSIGLKDL